MMTIASAEAAYSSRGSSRSQRYIFGVVTSCLGVFVSAVISLGLVPYTLRFLDPTEFAILNLATGILSWLMLFNFGIAGGLRVQAAQLASHADATRLDHLVSTAVFAQAALAILVLTVGVAIAVTYPWVFDIGSSTRRSITVVIIIFALSAALTVVLQPFSALLVARQFIYITNLVRISAFIIRAILIVMVLQFGGRLIALSVVTAVTNALVAAVGVLVCYRFIPDLNVSGAFKSWRAVRELGGLSLWIALSNVSATIITGLDRTIVGGIVSLPAVTILILNGKPYELAAGILGQAALIAQPAFGQLITEQPLTVLLNVYRRFSLLFTGVSTVTFVTLWSANSAFLSKWVGAHYYGGRLLDLMLALTLLVNALLLPQRTLLTAALQLKSQALMRITEALVNLALSIVLTIQFGIIGVVIATLIASLATSFWFSFHLTARFFRVSFLSLLRETLLPLILPLAILIGLALAMRELISAIPAYQVIGAAIVIAMSGVALMWFLYFDSETRCRVVRMCADIRRSLSTLNIRVQGRL